jgi:hypothetical protein
MERSPVHGLTAALNRRKHVPGDFIMADYDNPQLSLGGIIANLPAVRAAKKVNTMSRVHRRLIEPIETEQDNEPRLSFQHTVFCQAGLPYRNPGDDVREWQREQGAVSVLVEAGQAKHPKTHQWVKLGLPWGTKPRLILAHLNAEALRRDLEGTCKKFAPIVSTYKGGDCLKLEDCFTETPQPGR